VVSVPAPLPASNRPRRPVRQNTARDTLLGIKASELTKRAWRLLGEILAVSVAIVVLVLFVNDLIEDLQDADWWVAVVDAAVAVGVLALIFLGTRRRRNGNAETQQ